MNQKQADEFAAAWIGAWNAHDLDGILAHYHPDVRFVSPFVVELTGAASGELRGVAALRDYFGGALERFADLRFELIHVVPGVNSVTIVYRSVRNLLAAEMMLVDRDGRVTEVRAHYAPR